MEKCHEKIIQNSIIATLKFIKPIYSDTFFKLLSYFSWMCATSNLFLIIQKKLIRTMATPKKWEKKAFQLMCVCDLWEGSLKIHSPIPLLTDIGQWQFFFFAFVFFFEKKRMEWFFSLFSSILCQMVSL